MEAMNRRAFLARSSAVMAAAGAAALAPTQLVSAATRSASTQPEREAMSSSFSPQAVTDEPFIVHVRNPQRGEIAIYAGSDEYTLIDQQLVSRLTQVAGGH